MTSRCPRVAGLMSMNAIVRSSSSMICPGSSPATILQKMQSGSLTAGSLALARGRLRRSDELAGPLDRLLARVDLTREARLLELSDDLAELAPGSQPDRAGKLVAPQGQPWPVLAPYQRLAQQLSGQLQMPADRLLGAASA